MEESKPAQGETAAQVVDPPSAVPPPPPPPPASASALPPKSKKRPLDGNLQIENSKYFKMRLVLKDLRPHFLEVLQTPDFQNCKATEEIREKMKLMVELYQQMTGEATRQDNTSISHSTPNGNEANQTAVEQKRKAKSSETSSFQIGNVSEKQEPGDGIMTGTHVVGGSAFGWNFITFGGIEPVYYGVTKETYRSSHPISEGQ